MSIGFVSARTEQARMIRSKSTQGKGNGGASIGGTSTGGTSAEGAAPSATLSTTAGITEGDAGATSEKGQEGVNEAVPPRDDDNNNKSKLTLSVATVCGEGTEGTDEGDPPVRSHIYLPFPLVLALLICPNVPTLPTPLSLHKYFYPILTDTHSHPHFCYILCHSHELA